MNLDPRSIIVAPDRQRKDLGDLSQLIASVKEFGVIEPLVVVFAGTNDQGDNVYKLVAGERRLRSALQAGLTSVPCHAVDEVPDWQLEAIELEENYNRKQLTWQETVVAINRVHQLHKTNAALESKPWGMAHTAALFGITSGNVSYCTQLAELVQAGDKEIIACSGVWEAYQLLLNRKTRAAMAEQAARISLLPTRVQAAPPSTMKVTGKPECVACGGTGLSTSGKPCVCATVTFEKAPQEERSATAVTTTAVGLSIVLSNDHYNDFFARTLSGFDHIYTDPPYAIDMDNLDQQNIGMNVDAVKHSHDVDDNKKLLSELCSWACFTLPKHGWLVMWCDYTMWHELKRMLETHDDPLRVQRWPFIWTKSSPCQNGAPYHNFTKTTECAIVAARSAATLSIAGPLGHWFGGADKQQHNPTNPFWKPLEMHSVIIDAISRPGQTICDPFAGSGSIPVACQRKGRSILANDYDPVHYNDMRARLLNTKPAEPDLLDNV